MNLQYLKIFIKEKIQQYPKLTGEIMDFYYLCLSEIEDGGSQQSEIQSCISDVNGLIEENNK
jgi:hypothetical protein